MRLFFALQPPDAQRLEMARCVEELSVDLHARFVPAKNLHLTLAFLGEVDPGRIPELEGAAATLTRRPAFVAEWGGLECFPNPARARVVALGARRAGPELSDLAQALRAALPGSLRPASRAPFRPHLTVARFREPPPRDAVLRLGEELAPFSWQSRVERVDLLRSHLDSEGARYETLLGVDLAAS